MVFDRCYLLIVLFLCGLVLNLGNTVSGLPFGRNNAVQATGQRVLFDTVRNAIQLVSTSCNIFNRINEKTPKNQININNVNMLYFYSNEFHQYQIQNTTKLLSKMSTFKSSVPTIVFIPGFNNKPDEPVMKEIAINYLRKQPVNFLSYNISMYVQNNYLVSANHSPYLAKILSNFIMDLLDMGVSENSIHLIGYSLGAQIAGLAGRRLKRRHNIVLSRITALDPASPCFTNLSLNEYDAKYVDVIHTSILSFSDNRMGHADFYVNGDLGLQPGCDPIDIPCSHARSSKIYAESILNENGFVAMLCEKSRYSNYKCNKNELSLLGYASSPNTRGVYYLRTNPASPFAMN